MTTHRQSRTIASSALPPPDPGCGHCAADHGDRGRRQNITYGMDHSFQVGGAPIIRGQGPFGYRPIIAAINFSSDSRRGSPWSSPALPRPSSQNVGSACAIPPLRATTMTFPPRSGLRRVGLTKSSCWQSRNRRLAKPGSRSKDGRSKAAQKNRTVDVVSMTGHDTAGEVKGGNLRGRHRAGQIGTRRRSAYSRPPTIVHHAPQL